MASTTTPDPVASFDKPESMRKVALTALTMLLGRSVAEWCRSEPLETDPINQALGWLREGIAKQDRDDVARYLGHAVNALNQLLES
jgi:hypothetical protein